MVSFKNSFNNFKIIILGLHLILTLNGCLQNTVFLGSIYTFTSTGSIYQTSLSYGSSKTVKKITKKNSPGNIKSFEDNKNCD